MSECDETPDILPVSCGMVTGLLHRNRFICPGIHQECIEVGGQIVTPKTFSVMGEKEKLKDWKNAIRINGVSVRKMMDCGDLHFWNHSVQCTGKCVSRNAGVSKYDISRFQEPEEGEVTSFTPLVAAMSELGSEAAYTVLREVTGDSNDGSAVDNNALSGPVFPGMPLGIEADGHTDQTHIKHELGRIIIKQEVEDTEELCENSNGDTADPVPLQINGVVGDQTWPAELDCHISQHDDDLDGDDDILEAEDSQAFWQGILSVGLIDDFFREIKTSLDVVKNDIIRRQASDPEDCCRISRIVSELGLMTKLKWKLNAHKSETEQQKEKLNMQINALKKKMAESEQKQKELKRKSDCFERLIERKKKKGQKHASDTSAASPISEASCSSGQS